MPTALTVTSPIRPVNAGEVDVKRSKSAVIILFILIAAAVIVSVIPRDGSGLSIEENTEVEAVNSISWYERAFIYIIVVILIIIIIMLFCPDYES